MKPRTLPSGRLGIASLLLITLSGSSSLCGAARACQLQPDGPNFDLTSGATTQRLAPAVSFNTNNREYVVVWFDTRNPGNNDVFGQRVSTDGTLVGLNFPVIQFSEAQIDPWIAHNPVSNEYLVAWRTQQAGFFNRGRARRVAADGSLIGGDFLVGNGNEIFIAYNMLENQFLVTGRSPDIRGQRVSDVGTLVGPEILITNVGAPAPNGQVAYDWANNAYLATWRDQVSLNLQGQRIAADGSLLGGPILISSSFPGSGRTPISVAFDLLSENYLVVFGLFQDTDIVGQFVASDGSLVGSNFTIATGLTDPANPYVIYSMSAQCFVVFWKDGSEIIAQALTPAGDIAGDPLTVSSGSVAGEPVAAVNDIDGQILVAWTDNRNLPGGQQDIFAQRLICTSPDAAPEAGVGEGGARLLGCAPNPMSDRTAIRFRLGASVAEGEAAVEILGPEGRLVRTLPGAGLAAGTHVLEWDGADVMGRRVASGVYFTRMRVGGRVVSGPRVLVLR